jgi:hypothetical protein
MDRRAFLFYGACCAFGLARGAATYAQAGATSLDEPVIAALLTWLHGDKQTKTPLLLMRTPYMTSEMVVTTATYTPLQRASHQAPDLPYIHPPEDRIAEAQELSSDYNQKLKSAPSLIQDSLRLSFPHVLLSDEETRQFFRLYPQGNVYSPELEADRRRVPKQYKRLFGGATSICSISRVGFNATKTLAVLGVRNAGGSCSSESWYVMGRSESGVWASLPWIPTGIAICA